MIRDDGSIKSTNFPDWDNRYQVRDFGIYRGVVIDVLYTDDELNDSGTDNEANEVVYSVMIIGGDRDGQLFPNARLMKTLGGFANFEEVTLKKRGGITQADPTTLLGQTDPSVKNIEKFNGDVVYIQFVNGEPHLPLIVGLGYHQAATDPEATGDEGPRYRRNYNGIFTETTKDGEFTWSKDNGAFVPFLPTNPLAPFVDQFAPIPGQEQAVILTLGNKFDLLLAYNTGLMVSVDGLKDSFGFTTAAGAAYTLDGIKDSHELATSVGTIFKVDGLSDSLELTTSAGAAVKIDGLNDAITITAAFGDTFSVTAKDGIQASTPTGTTLSMKNGQVDMASGGMAALSLTKEGFVKLGNSGGDVLKDILLELIKSLSTATYAGFGAPGSNVADFVQLLVKLQLITG